MRRAAPWLAAGLGVLLVVAGAVLFARADGVEEVVYGGSYEPLSVDAAYSSTLALTYDDAVVWTRAHLAGLASGAAGALLLAAVGGWLVGRRSVATPS